jgi:cytoskeleton protein RodZ
MAAALRIRLAFLEALELGRIEELPGNAYVLAFLRTYATALGLDPDDLSRRYRAEAGELSRKAELDFPVPLPERGPPAGALVLLGLVLAAGAYVGWYRLSGEGRLPAETVAPVPARLAPLAQQAIPPVVVAAGPPVAPPATAGSPPPRVGAQPGASDAPLSPSSAAAATPGPAQPAVNSASVENGAASNEPGLVVRATADAWIQVRDRNGQVLFSRILHPGESWSVPPGANNPVFTTGNAGGTELVLDGVATAPLGNPGAVRRDMPLDPEAVRSGRLAPFTSATR